MIICVPAHQKQQKTGKAILEYNPGTHWM